MSDEEFIDEYEEGNLDVKNGEENFDILPAADTHDNDKPRITSPYMTKFERARVLGTRALQVITAA